MALPRPRMGVKMVYFHGNDGKEGKNGGGGAVATARENS